MKFGFFCSLPINCTQRIIDWWHFRARKNHRCNQVKVFTVKMKEVCPREQGWLVQGHNTSNWQIWDFAMEVFMLSLCPLLWIHVTVISFMAHRGTACLLSKHGIPCHAGWGSVHCLPDWVLESDRPGSKSQLHHFLWFKVCYLPSLRSILLIC